MSFGARGLRLRWGRCRLLQAEFDELKLGAQHPHLARQIKRSSRALLQVLRNVLDGRLGERTRGQFLRSEDLFIQILPVAWSKYDLRSLCLRLLQKTGCWWEDNLFPVDFTPRAMPDRSFGTCLA